MKKSPVATQYTDEYLSDEGILWEIANYDMAREWQGAEIDNMQSDRLAQLFALFSRTHDASLEVQYSEICECILDDIKPVKRNGKAEPVKPQAEPVNQPNEETEVETVISFYVPDSSVETCSIFRNVNYGFYFAGLSPTQAVTSAVDDYSKCYLDLCDLYFPRIPEIFPYSDDNPRFDPNEYREPDREFEIMYADLEPETTQLYFDWAPAYDEAEPVKPSILQRANCLADWLEDQIGFMSHPIIVATLYFAVLALVATTFLNR